MSLAAPFRRSTALALLVVGPLAAGMLAACSRSDASADPARTRAARATRPAETPVITASGYAVGSAGTGSVTGAVAVSGTVAPDSAVRPSTDADVCGASVTAQTVNRRGDGVGDVVVWLSDVKRGKAMPVGRRFDVAVERCALTPRVQGAIAGGTLNVASFDQLLHALRFTHQGPGDSLAVVRESEAGSLVPSRAPLAAAGLVEIDDPRHPWERGWVAVFDHPYWAVTAPDGRFSLDSVPAGTYHLRAWHERFGVTEQTVTVGAGEATVAVTLTAK